MRSACCGGTAYVEGKTTNFYVCSACGLPCDTAPRLTEICPECHTDMRHEGGCKICPSCGYTPCE